MADRPSYTSNQLAQRDQKVMETHEKELDVLRNKNERLRRNFDDSEKLRFEERQRANKLAMLLGYGDAQQAIFDLEELAIEGTSLRDFKTRAHDAQGLLEKEIAEAEKLRLRLKEVEQEVKRLNAERYELEEKYDALNVVKDRCAEQYKKNFKKWSRVNKWLFGDDTGDIPEIKKGSESLLKRRQAMRDYEPNASMLQAPEKVHPPLIPQSAPDVDKENSLMPPLKKRRVSANVSASHSSATNTPATNTPTTNTPTTDTPTANTPAGLPLVRNTLLTSITNMEPPSCSPTVFLDTIATTTTKAKSRTPSRTRVPLSFKPIEELVNIIHEPQEPSLTPCPVGGRNAEISPPESPIASQVFPGSSQTEDDSQAITVPSTSTQLGRTTVFRVPAPPPPAPGSVYWDRHRRNPSHPSLPPRPSFATTQTATKVESSRRPFSMQDIIPPKTMLETPSSTPRATLLHDSAPSVKGKERATEHENVTPMTSRTQGQKRIDDYSAFKGRGRYGKQDEPTINKLYTIASEKNHGRDYQYDEVVRRKDDRRKLDGGDCECCREYYEGVGPLPRRLQPPLWRSPSKSQSQMESHSPSRRPCLNRGSSPSPPRFNDTDLTHSVDRHPNGARTTGGSHHRAEGSRRRHSEISEHKKAISRHRQNWERAKTPPGYWDIGFPDTQEVGNINEKAREMHKRKKDEVEREAAMGNGRYRRR